MAATQFDETTTFYSNWGGEMDIAAPGGNMRVDQNGDGKPDGVLQNTVIPGNIAKADYLWFMGTSMASPHVAGVAALVVGAGVNKPDAVDAILRSTARAPKAQGHRLATGRVDDHYGAGIVDAGAALRKAKVDRGAGGAGAGAVAGAAGPGRPAPARAAGGAWAGACRRRPRPARAGCSSCPGRRLAANPLLLSAALPLAGVARSWRHPPGPAAGWAGWPSAWPARSRSWRSRVGRRHVRAGHARPRCGWR